MNFSFSSHLIMSLLLCVSKRMWNQFSMIKVWTPAVSEICVNGPHPLFIKMRWEYFGLIRALSILLNVFLYGQRSQIVTAIFSLDVLKGRKFRTLIASAFSSYETRF